MAKISAGVGCSHVPAIGAAMDLGKTGEDYWVPLFKGFEKSKEWIAEKKPDEQAVHSLQRIRIHNRLQCTGRRKDTLDDVSDTENLVSIQKTIDEIVGE